MLSSFLNGFFIGISLIMAIGAQNTFILRQGLIGKHLFIVALFCAVSDTLLISIGVFGIPFFFNTQINLFLDYIFGFASLWLFCYGILRVKDALNKNLILKIEASKNKSLVETLSIVAVLTFINPHVYLDTMILIGVIAQQFLSLQKIAFAIGASLSSFIFFFTLVYSAKLITPIMQTSLSWRILDFLIAIIMFIIAINLASAGNWI
jgi:L-lysine exporter family protein LysE/ArgO